MAEHSMHYWLQDAPNEHPQTVMRRLSEQLKFRILDATPQCLSGSWWLKVQWDGEKPAFPKYLTEDT